MGLHGLRVLGCVVVCGAGGLPAQFPRRSTKLDSVNALHTSLKLRL